jgi:hypothetical protein
MNITRFPFKTVYLALGICCVVFVTLFSRNRMYNDLLSSTPIASDQFVYEAQLSKDWNNDTELDIEDEGKFHVVTNIVLYTRKADQVNLLFENKRPPTIKELTDRQRELEMTLQSNLNHPKVAAIHILHAHPVVMLYLHKLKLKNSKKMVLHYTH